MTSTRGGHRVRSGPPPDPNALNRARDGKSWTVLPAKREGGAPEWPLEVPPPTMSEQAMWNRIWSLPQGYIWEASRSHDVVALYVRVLIEAMQPASLASTRTQARTLANDLCLTQHALLSARFVIAGSEEDQAIAAAVARHPAGRQTGTRPKSARDRFTVVAPEPDEDDDKDGA